MTDRRYYMNRKDPHNANVQAAERSRRSLARSHKIAEKNRQFGELVHFNPDGTKNILKPWNPMAWIIALTE